jgi:hypothetical protein
MPPSGPPAVDRRRPHRRLPGITSFAKGLEQDTDAVTNGLTMPWSFGPVEGHVSFKMLKRQMCGRAGLPLQACPAHRSAMTGAGTFTKLRPDPTFSRKPCGHLAARFMVIWPPGAWCLKHPFAAYVLAASGVPGTRHQAAGWRIEG